ncbi:unannotated protein [freshwater metagenome]|uniref:Unannotated protein n=1 Tax=freshwater metagenome TaxID=449393 RepID=A0A6J7GVJ3_9ZZZZ
MTLLQVPVFNFAPLVPESLNVTPATGAISTVTVRPRAENAHATTGFAGALTGFTLTASDAAPLPSPTPLMARRRTEYVVPFVSPVIVTGEAASPGLSAVHKPPSSEYS